MPRRLSKATAAAIALMATGFAAAGCGSNSITADTKCKDYLSYPLQQRHDAAVRISLELRTNNPGNPMWGLSLDTACGGARSETIRDYFEHGSSSPGSNADASAPPLTGGSSCPAFEAATER